MVYGFGIPKVFKNAVGKAQRQQVLYGFFAQIVVNTEDVALVEVLRNLRDNLFSALQVVAQGLFNHYAVSLGNQTGLRQMLAADTKRARRSGQIEYPLLVARIEQLCQGIPPLIALFDIEIYGMDALGKCLPFFGIKLIRAQVLLRRRTDIVLVFSDLFFAPTHAQDRKSVV